MIRANYTEMKNAASNISNAGEEYRNNVHDFYKIIDSLSDHWKGADNLSFASTANNYKGNLGELGVIVDKYGRFLDSSASAIQGTQEEIANSARRL